MEGRRPDTLTSVPEGHQPRARTLQTLLGLHASPTTKETTASTFLHSEGRRQTLLGVLLLAEKAPKCSPQKDTDSKILLPGKTLFFFSPSKKVLIMCPFIYNFMNVSIEHVKKVEKFEVAMDVWHFSSLY